MLKITLSTVIISSFLLSMSVSQVNEASKNGLGCIKGIGDKRLQRVIEYKKEHSINSIADLLNIKGIGKGILKNIREDILKKSCRRDNQQSLNKEKSKRPRKKIDAK